MRIALLTFEALASAAPVRRFIAENPERIAFIALSNPYHLGKGGFIQRTLKILRASGLRIFPYLITNFVLPSLGGLLVRSSRNAAQCQISQLAARFNIPLSVEKDLNSAAFRAKLQQSGAEAILTFHCDQILSAETIGCLPFGGINVHPALLPSHRGPIPTVHALLEEEPNFGVSIHRLASRIDAGALLAQKPLNLTKPVSALTAARLAHEAATDMLPALLDAIAAGAATETELPLKPYCPFPTRKQLKALARSKRKVADCADVTAALQTPI
jgi:folate-dependent phosphoribosylglycinamide formyltransferase PurN